VADIGDGKGQLIFGCIMALGWTRPLTEMNTRNISWGVRRPVHWADNLPTFMYRLFWNLGASNSWNLQGLPRPVMGLLLTFALFIYCLSCIYCLYSVSIVCTMYLLSLLDAGLSLLDGGLLFTWVPDGWLEVSSPKVLRPAISTQVFLGFPGS
jgi:hypothetical protein